MAKQTRAAWFKIFLHYKPFINEMTNEELGNAYRAAMEYFDTQTELPLSRSERFLFLMMKESIDEAFDDYEVKKENGKKGGRPKNQKEPEVISGSEEKANKTEADADAEAEADADADADAEVRKEAEAVVRQKPPRPRFVPPTQEELLDYCTKMGYRIDPTLFMDYYISNGWRVGKNPMKDWKAALRTWNTKEKEYGKNRNPNKPEIPTWTVGTTF